jgi:hypothetical protein
MKIARLARLRGLRSGLIDPAIARIVKRTGDGSIIEFRSVMDAVRCAIEPLGFRAFYPSREATIDLRAWPAPPRPVSRSRRSGPFAERAQLVEPDLIDQPDHVFALCVVSCVALQGGRLGR